MAVRRGSGRNRITNDSESMRIEGLAEFNRALKVAAESFPNELKKANYDVAALIVRAAKMRASREPGVAAKAAKSLRVTRSATYAAVSGGGARYPYFYGAEFGSKRYGQFQSWRGNQWGGWAGGPGYFLHPAIRNEGPAILNKYMETLDEITARAFPE